MKTAPELTACECGCDLLAPAGKRFIRGHWSRTPDAQAMYTQRRQADSANPSGLCMCGCGGRTPLATSNRSERGYYIGQPTKFILGHQHVTKGQAHHLWRGGRVTTPSGYVYIYAPDHPYANGKGYVYEHRVVMETRLGRLLTPSERVHHHNSDRSDNRDKNLILFSSQSHHMREGHQDALEKWKRTNPERAQMVNSDAGKKGAAERWKK